MVAAQPIIQRAKAPEVIACNMFSLVLSSSPLSFRGSRCTIAGVIYIYIYVYIYIHGVYICVCTCLCYDIDYPSDIWNIHLGSTKHKKPMPLGDSVASSSTSDKLPSTSLPPSSVAGRPCAASQRTRRDLIIRNHMSLRACVYIYIYISLSLSFACVAQKDPWSGLERLQ